MDSHLEEETLLGLHRFGLGPRSDLQYENSDPKELILGDLQRLQGPPAPALKDSGVASREAFANRQDRRAEQKRQRELRLSGLKQDGIPPTASTAMAGTPAALILQDEADWRYDLALAAPVGLQERLVWFWSNHFCVNSLKTPALAGAFEREAIRPFVAGRFGDMLSAVIKHPAMIAYLDNQRSAGPNSETGLSRNRGLNENLAREILELHTLGVEAGYTQADVTALAKIISGWTVIPVQETTPLAGEFSFDRRLHEPGSQTLLGMKFDQEGLDKGEAALQALARSPSTASHIARKFARHFVSDEPAPALVDRLAANFRDRDGDLNELTKVLVSSPEAWLSRRDKIRRPGEWLMACCRGLGINPGTRFLLDSQKFLGEPLWQPPGPNGFSDDSTSWLEGIGQRLDVAVRLSQMAPVSIDADAAMNAILGPLARPETRQAVERAESRMQSLTILLMAAELHRR